MALRHIEGFDGASATDGTGGVADVRAYMETKYSVNTWSGTNNPLVRGGWLGGKGITLGIDGFTDQNWYGIQIPLTQTVIIGFAMRGQHYEGGQVADIVRVNNIAENTNQLRLRLEHSTTLVLLRGSSVLLDASRGALRMGRWNYIEMKFTISNTVGAYDVRVNGVTVMSDTNVDTKDSGTSDNVDLVAFFGIDGNADDVNRFTMYDDIYIADTSGAANNDFLGPTKVEELLPTGVGDSNQFTPSAGANWQNVDETPFDNDTTYNQSSTSTNLDLFAASNLAIITGTVYGVQSETVARVTEPDPFSLVPKVKSSTTEGTGTSKGLGNTSAYETVLHLFEQDPNISAAWTVSTVNAMQIGYEVG